MTTSPSQVHRSRRAMLVGIVAVSLTVTLGALCQAPAARSPQVNYSTATGQGLPFPHRNLANVTFVAFDTETTGLSPSKNRIVEIAAVKYRNGKIIDEKTWLVNPGTHIPHWARDVHGISDAMVKDAPAFPEVYREFTKFIEGSVLVAHNARFDINFVDEELKRADIEFPPNPVIDSLGLFRTWFPGLKSYALKNVAVEVKVDQGGYHRALADSMYVALVFNKGAEKLPAAKLRDVYADAGGKLNF